MNDSVRQAMLWVIATFSVAMLPQLLRMPPLVAVLVVLPLAWRIASEARGWKPLPGAVRHSLTVLALLALFFSYGDLSGRRAAVSLLTVMLSLKLIECYRIRDARLLVSFSLFLCATQFLFGQKILMPLYGGAVTVLALVTFARLQRLEAWSQDEGPPPVKASPASELSFALRLLALAVPAGLALFLLLPHLTLLVISFVPPGTCTTEAIPPVLDGSNYQSLASTPERLRPVLNSLWMATAATLGAIVLGLAAARTSVKRGGRLGSLLETLLSVPWALPGTVFAIALATAFSVNRPELGRFVLVGTPWILPMAYLVRSLPLTGRSSLAGLRQMDPSLEEAAASLGAGRLRRIWRVTLPLLRPAILAGASLAFITALGDFVTSIVLYTYDTRPISIEILSSLRLQDTGVAAVYGVLLMVVSATAFLVWGRERRA